MGLNSMQQGAVIDGDNNSSSRRGSWLASPPAVHNDFRDQQHIWADPSLPVIKPSANFSMAGQHVDGDGGVDWRTSGAPTAAPNLRQLWGDPHHTDAPWKQQHGPFDDGSSMNGDGAGWPPPVPRGIPAQPMRPRGGGRGNIPQGHPMGQRMMAPAPNFRQQFAPSPAPLVGAPFFPPPHDMMEMNTAMMSDMTLGGAPPMVPMQQRPFMGNGMMNEFNSPWGMAPPAQQPQPQQQFPSEEFFDASVNPYASTVNAQPPQMQQQQRPGGGVRPPFNRPQNRGQNFRAPGQQHQMFHQQPMMQQQQQPPFFPQQPQQQHPQQFRQSYVPQQQQQQQQQPHQQAQQPDVFSNQNFVIGQSSMDDYSLWTDEHDEETKKKKSLRDKGLLGWGDADVSNAQPINRWLISEGEEEDLDTALQRCPMYQKKKVMQEEALRKRLQENPEGPTEETDSVRSISSKSSLPLAKKPIVPCGWGDLPPEFAEKRGNTPVRSGSGAANVPGDFRRGDYADMKTWEDLNVPTTMGAPRNGPPMQMSAVANGAVGGHPPVDRMSDEMMPWNLPHQDQRNPFFAQHMQQQQQGEMGGPVYMDYVGGGPNNSWMTDGVLSHIGNVINEENADSANGVDVAVKLRRAVEKGFLDMQVMTLQQLPPQVLELLTTMLGKIPYLENVEADLLNLVESSRPAGVAFDAEPTTWLSSTQKGSYDRMVISKVTSKIEVQELSRKINRALVDAGLFSPSKLTPTTVPTSAAAGPVAVVAPSATSNHHSPNNLTPPVDQGERHGDIDQPPVQCDYYDYSFLG